MKKVLLLAVFTLAMLGFGSSLFAQDAPRKFKESEYYYYNIPIEKIYAYRMGYVVIYRKGVNQMARTYLPDEWFTTVGGKGELIGLSSGTEWPSMSVYYKSGKFSHIRLRVRRDRSHETWGVVPLTVNLDKYFEGVEEVRLEF